MFPHDFPRAIVDSAQEASPGETVVCAGPAIGAVLGLEEVDAVAILRVDDEQTGLRIETRRPEIGSAAFVRSNQDTVAAGFLGRVGNRPALLVDPLAPIDGGEGFGEQALAVGAIENKEVAVPGRL